ncbi:MAG: ATP-binding protein [Syntrophobacterales bacterium]|jgi:SpoVK/Ycf46/Vps4 family AAA+-type ATPase|nr:ATP-binding protein [Syntrophobacterales bacterium]
MGPWQKLPDWGQEMAEHLREGESALFILHGQVFDYIRVNGDYLPFRHFLAEWLAQERHVVCYNLGLGLEFWDPAGENAFRQALEPPAPNEADAEEDVSRVRARALRALGQPPQPKPLPQSPREVLQLAERVMATPCQPGGLSQPLALILEYAETIVPAVDLSSMGEADRASLVTLLRWARQRELVEQGHVVILTTGNLAELNANLLLSRHGAQIIEVPPPDQAARLHFIEHLLASGAHRLELSSQELANLGAGLSLGVIRALVRQARRAPLTVGMVRRKKKDLLRQELVGLIEVIEPRFGLEEIGGLDPIKTYLTQVVRAIHAGDHKLVPRGITMMGPPGVGKTALAEALARDSGFNFVKLLNPRTKWVGESERNFFKALQTLRSLTPVVVVEDEADQSEHGRDEFSGDSGVSNRLRQMRFEFMGDPAIQGKVLWIRITNRPDRLDKADLRSGRSSERIPFFMPDSAEKSHICAVVAARSHIPCDFTDFGEVTRYLEARHPDLITGGDIEELVFRAYRQARLAGREQVGLTDFQQVIDDFLPPHQVEVLRHMEKLALHQCSSRRFIPDRVWAWAGEGEEGEEG